MQELLNAVCDYYGDPVDDRKSEDLDHASLHLYPIFVKMGLIKTAGA